MELPPDDEGVDLGDAPPLPDEGQQLPGLPDDDTLWLEELLGSQAQA